jgi:hypothetical protein
MDEQQIDWSIVADLGKLIKFCLCHHKNLEPA